jgi:hypothetical protein
MARVSLTGDKNMEKNLQSEETPIDQVIVQELVALTPESWRSIQLEVTDTSDANVQKHSHQIKSLEGYHEPVQPSDPLFDATYRLWTLFKQYGRGWRKATYRVNVEGDGAIQYTVDFEY